MWDLFRYRIPAGIRKDFGDFRYKNLTSNTEVFGVVGNPISHSISPALHNASF